MKNGTEVRMWLYGTECELRPVSAAAYLKARNEAEKLKAEYGEGEVAKELVYAACVVSQGVYEDGERLFSTGDDVLKELTPEEIFSVWQEYEEAYAEKRKSSPSDSEEDMLFSVPRANGETSDFLNAAEKEKSRAVKKLLRYIQNTEKVLNTGETAEKRKNLFAGREVKDREPADKPQRGRPGFAEDALKQAADETENAPAKKISVERFAKSGMAEVSNFFERDCRRYDGAFKRY